MTETLRPGQIRLRGVSRRFRLHHDRGSTLKDVLVRRRRTRSTTELWALREVDLDIAPGESVGLIGQNGTGKSTLLKLVAGILNPQGGTVEAGGVVASMLELGAGFHPDFTGRENVYLNASIYGLSERDVDERFDSIVGFGGLEEFIDMPVRTYSSGMYMRLAFAIASHVDPDVLLLDEVLAVGDEAFQHKCFGRIQQFQREGGTLLYVSHDPTSVVRLCQRALLLVDGRIAADGPPADVLSHYHRMLSRGGRVGGGDARSPQPPDATDGDNGHEWGTRDVVITASRLIGPNGPTDRFLSGEPMTVELEVEPHAPIATPTFGVAVYTASGVLCFGSNTRLDPLDTSMLQGPATVRFAIPSLHLHDGEFLVSVAAHSSDESVVYHWLDRRLEFTVFSNAPGIGLVDLTGEWSVTADEGTTVASPPRVT